MISKKLLKRLLYPTIFKQMEKNYINKIVKETKYDFRSIKSLLNQFKVIQKNIKCAHNEFEFLVMYAMILMLRVEGPIVELGCYKGGSSAKLSLISKLTGRKLYIFDSFEGLPSPKREDRKHKFIPLIIDKNTVEYKKGDYAASIEDVKKNIGRYGNLEFCSFIKGYFHETLPKFNLKPSCIFMDVDYIESALFALKNLWPKLETDGIFFTHESCVSDFIKAITDQYWWDKELDQKPPLLYGAGYGTCWRWGPFAFPSNVAYFIK